jgi:hypothetical protein
MYQDQATFRPTSTTQRAKIVKKNNLLSYAAKYKNTKRLRKRHGRVDTFFCKTVFVKQPL